MDYRQRPLLLVVFGITGDLAHRKILPALCTLYGQGALPDVFKVIGITRGEHTAKQLYDEFAASCGDSVDKSHLAALQDATTIVTLDMQSRSSYEQLRAQLEKESALFGAQATRVYYLSIPAQAFIDVISQLGETGHNQAFANETIPPRLLVEKPFGYDLPSAKTLVEAAEAYFDESQLYRIDHYLAKETAQNILTFRFDNPLFQTIWNARHIDKIVITANEKIGVEGRANFYEQTGALRDIIQSHLLQLLALVTMEHPGRLDSEHIRRAKKRLLESIVPIKCNDIALSSMRGQYIGYKEEVRNPKSYVETFARLQLEIDNEQWRGTSIVLESGKALSQKESRVAVHFRSQQDGTDNNILTFRLQPHEGITLSLRAKKPGLSNETEVVNMAFDYKTSFDTQTSEAYERVLIDAIRGDQSLFLSSQEVLACWQIVENVIESWQTSGDGMVLYEPGTHPESMPR